MSVWFLVGYVLAKCIRVDRDNDIVLSFYSSKINLMRYLILQKNVSIFIYLHKAVVQQNAS